MQMKDPTHKNLDGTDLSARIAATKEGQCTWACPDLKKHCTACAHYRDGEVTRGKNQGYGFCALVKVHTKKRGKLFDGTAAWACGQYDDPREVMVH